MTVNTTTITAGPYLGNDVTTYFSYGFRIESKDQVKVYETDDAVPPVQTLLTVDTDYTVNDVGVDGGGTITRVAGALPAGYEWYIRSNFDYTQETDFDTQGSFSPLVHEAAFDKNTYQIQQMLDLQERALRYSESADDAVDTELPRPEADKVLVWNADGDAIINGPSEGTFQVYADSAASSALAADASADEAAASAVLVEAAKLMWLGAYSGATAYAVNDAVSEGGASYICILATTGNAPPNGTYWDILAAQGATGGGTGDMLAAQNLNDVDNIVTAKSNLGMANVDNTSDVNKPVSTAGQTALDLKSNIAGPTFTGVPAAPTATAGTNTTQLATTAFVTAAVPDTILLAEAQAGTATIDRLWTAQRVAQAIDAQAATYTLPDAYKAVDTYAITGALTSTRVLGTAYSGSSLGLTSGTWRVMGLAEHTNSGSPAFTNYYSYLAIRIS